MKKFLTPIFTLAAIALLAGCAKEEDKRLPVEEGLVPVTFSVNLDGAAATKAFSDGTTADALLVGVYNQQGEGTSATYTYLSDLSVTSFTGEKAVPVTGKAAIFKTTLIRGQKYVLVFWAQKASSSAYTVDFTNQDLSVSNAGDANDETRDAFYKVYETGVISETNKDFTGIELKRPFAQINVLAPNADVANAAMSKVLLSKTAMSVEKVPTKMNILTGEVSSAEADLKTFTFSAAAITEQPFDDYSSTHTYIAMNYVLAGAEKALYNVKLDVGNTVNAVEQTPIHFDINSVPAQRNFRTNIIGNVFTLDASFNIIIAPEYQAPDWDKLLGDGTFEPTTITPTVSPTLPEGVGITAGTGTQPATITFAAGTTNPLTISAVASSEAQIKAQTSNAAVATAAVSGSNVTINPVGPGEATVTIYTDPVLATKAIDETKNYAAGKLVYKVVVEAPAEKKDVSIVCQDVNLKVGGSWELEPEVTPEELYTEIVATPAEGYATYFDWDADNWIIEAKKETPEGGIAITLSYPGNDEYKEASTTIHVIISEKAVPEIAFENFAVKVGETKTLADLYDVDEGPTVSFEAEAEQDVYELTATTIKGLKGGSATLTLKLAETATTAATSKTVTVTVNKIAPTVKAENLELTVGDIKTLVAGEDFTTNSDGEVSLTVDPDYTGFLTVEPGTLKIKALKEGEGMFSINVAESDKYLAGSEVVVVTINPAPVQEPETATIEITGVPTAAVEPGGQFDVTITTNSSAPVVVSISNGAGVNKKSDNTYTVTASDNLTEDTEVTLTASVAAVENAFTAAETTAKFTVKKKEDVVPPTSSEYVKITSTADVTDGDYLIVYEGESAVAFNGSLETLDAVGNTIAVTIASGKIAGSEAIDAAVFSFDVYDEGFSIQSASGKYIGRTTTGNGLNANDTAILNTIEVTDGVAAITSNGLVLKYNKASNQTRFRYYGSGQEDIAIYKKVGSGSGATPTQKENPTLTINGTIPTEAMVKDATFDFSVATNSTGAITVTLTPEGAATVAAKANAEKTWTVTAGEPSAETTVTLTVSVAATDTYKAASATKTFKVAKKAGDDPTEVITATVAEFLAAEVSASQKYQLTGIVTKHNNSIDTTYGNFDLVDESGTVYVYGLTATEKELTITSETNFKGNNDKSYSTLGIEEGDEVTLIGYRGAYNTTIEVIGAYYVSHKADTTPKFGASINGETIAAAGGTKTVTVTGNVAWTATATGGATLSADSGEGAGTITVTIPANTSETLEPEYTVTVSTAADVETKSYSFTVKQSKYVAPSGDETTVSTTIADYATANSWVNETRYDSIVLDSNISADVSAKSTTGNTGKYYTNGNNWRFYQGEEAKLIINAANGATLKSVKVEFTVTNNGALTYEGNAITSGTEFEVSGTSAELVVGNSGTATNGQVRFTSIEVTYN